MTCYLTVLSGELGATNLHVPVDYIPEVHVLSHGMNSSIELLDSEARPTRFKLILKVPV